MGGCCALRGIHGAVSGCPVHLPPLLSHHVLAVRFRHGRQAFLGIWLVSLAAPCTRRQHQSEPCWAWIHPSSSSLLVLGLHSSPPPTRCRMCNRQDVAGRLIPVPHRQAAFPKHREPPLARPVGSHPARRPRCPHATQGTPSSSWSSLARPGRLGPGPSPTGRAPRIHPAANMSKPALQRCIPYRALSRPARPSLVVLPEINYKSGQTKNNLGRRKPLSSASMARTSMTESLHAKMATHLRTRWLCKPWVSALGRLGLAGG